MTAGRTHAVLLVAFFHPGSEQSSTETRQFMGLFRMLANLAHPYRGALARKAGALRKSRHRTPGDWR
jgi:hypothetical protein